MPFGYDDDMPFGTTAATPPPAQPPPTPAPAQNPYVPTGGGNDPNTWKDNPGYGQGEGPNYSAGYNPNYGSFEDYKANRKAWRSTFQPGGWRYERNQLEDAAILLSQPKNQQQLGALLNKMGIFNQKEQRMARWNQIMSDFNNTGSFGGQFTFNPETGQKWDIGTSDIYGRGPQRMSPEDYALVNRGFYGRIADNLGVEGSFQNWMRRGVSSIEGTDPVTGLYYNSSGPGTPKVYYDKQGYQVDPTTGKRVGHYGLGTLASILAQLGIRG